MKLTWYYQNVWPITMVVTNKKNCYIKFKQLVACMRLNYKVAKNRLERHLIAFKDLKLDDVAVYPTTYFLNAKHLLLFFKLLHVTKLQKHLFLMQLNDHLPLLDFFIIDVIDKEEIDNNVVFGVTDNNVQFVILQDVKYFKASDVARLINCAPSYNISKNVNCDNIISWKRLKRLLLENSSCAIVKFAHNTIFLNEQGTRELIMAVTLNDDLYKNLCINSDNYDTTQMNCYNKPVLNRYRRLKKLSAESCVLGKYNNCVDFILFPTKELYFKLTQLSKMYRFKIHNYDPYLSYIAEWSRLEKNVGKHNIHWKPNTVMIEKEGAFQILKDVNLSDEANNLYFNFYHKTLNNFKDKSP
ncbi:ORF_83 [Adoxophyes orana granulovirus]|uniref:ADOR83 n=1 Tax=Adoxophyes orana granulovirus TaxID=170617 RepID=Q7T9T2_GVAO|nr:ORF_83 [Adoxophyes orana granulovirus]AAP85720.1 ORF_83 [Adoxophyes orana granulovirus]AJA91723.1 ADOR83 [Adoxophyes orana granulovirus]